MGDFYAEQLVKKKTDTKDILIKVLLLVLTVVSVLAVFMFPFGILLPVIFIVLDVFAFRWLDVEYEYLFMNGDLDEIIDSLIAADQSAKLANLQDEN